MKLSPVQLREQAAQLRATGEHLAAIRIYLALLSRNPEDYRTRMHLADALAQADVTAGAIKVYRTVADLCIAGGRPLVAMVACRAMEALGVSAESLLARLSQLFGQGSGHLGETGPGLRVRREDYQVDAKELRTGRTVEQLVAEAVQVGSQVEGLDQLPAKSFPIPLLSELSPPTLLAVERTMTVHRLPAGHVVFRQDEPGRSCFLLASGAVRVLMRQPGGEEAAVASLSDGAIFGEMSLITGSPRSATVQVTEESDLLELGPESLAVIGDELPRLASALDRLAQKRWMSNLMRQSPVFSAFNESERLELLKHFSAHEVPQGTVLIPQGVEVDGIYLVLRGEVGMVHREGEGQPRVVSREGPGSTLGLEHIVRGQPAAASATTMTPAMVLFLSASRVLRLVEAVPEFAEAIRTSAPPL